MIYIVYHRHSMNIHFYYILYILFCTFILYRTLYILQLPNMLLIYYVQQFRLRPLGSVPQEENINQLWRIIFRCHCEPSINFTMACSIQNEYRQARMDVGVDLYICMNNRAISSAQTLYISLFEWKCKHRLLKTEQVNITNI